MKLSEVLGNKSSFDIPSFCKCVYTLAKPNYKIRVKSVLPIILMKLWQNHEYRITRKYLCWITDQHWNTVNKAFQDMIESGLVTYDEDKMMRINFDSPFVINCIKSYKTNFLKSVPKEDPNKLKEYLEKINAEERVEQESDRETVI